ncbi:MAG: flippase [Candidatus Magasanikbacteria bacterium]
MSEKVAKNTAYMTIASILQKVIAFVYFTLIARYIGAEGTGKYFFALSFTTIFVIFVDMGFNNVLIREAAKMKDKMQCFFSTVISAKMLFAVLTYIATIVTINLMGYPEQTRHLVYLSAVTMVFDSFHQSIYGTLRAIGDLRWEAMGIVGSQVLTLSLGSYFLFFDFPLIFLILAFTIPSIINVIYSGTVLFLNYNIKFKPKFHKPTFVHLGKIAVPFALAAIFERVYSNVDTVILSKMAGNESVGWYSIPKKISNAFRFFPSALIAAIYPRFSEHFKNNKEKLSYLFERGMKYLLIIAFPIAVGIMILAPDIIVQIYTKEYLNSILPLRVLMVAMIFSFVGFLTGGMLNACEKQKTQTAIVGVTMVVNIILNLILIPEYGILGASIAALIGNAILAIVGYYFIPKITEISHNFLIISIVKIIFSVSVMAVLVWYSNIYFHFLVSIAVGAVVYPLVLFLTKTLTIKQAKEAIALVKK